MIVKVDVVGDVEQPLAVAVTVYVAVIGALVLLTAVNDPSVLVLVPLAGPPMLLLSLTKLYVVPDTVLVNVTICVVPLLHTDWLAGEIVIVGVGLTVIVKLDVVGVAEQPFGEVAVTIYVDVTGVF